MITEVAVLHNEYPDRTRVHVADKLEKLSRFFEGLISVRAILERQHDDHRVELVASVRKGVVLVVDSRAESMTVALDEAIDRMARVLSEHKAKLKAKRKTGAVVR